jgi:hypothetical protein
MDEELEQYLDAKFAEMDAKFATKADLERVETTLLTEFHKWRRLRRREQERTPLPFARLT